MTIFPAPTPPAEPSLSPGSPGRESRRSRSLRGWFLGLLAAVLAIGGSVTWWTAARADRELRADLVQQAQLLGQTVTVERVRKLTGADADTASPEYQRIKAQLALAKQMNEKYRFIYLMGRKPDGRLFFFVDSEPPSSKDYSPPGQVFSEASEANRRVFTDHTATIEGPVTDRWGSRVSALVPIHDPRAVRFGFATPDDARATVDRALDFYRRNGRARFLKEINSPLGEFRKGDRYAFVYDLDMTMLAHPVKPELVGRNLLDQKDWPGGTYFRKGIQALALSQGSGWVDYEYENPTSKEIEPKTTYVERVDDLIICSGAYKGLGDTVAMLGVDIDARTWNGLLARSALPPAACTLALAAILLIGWTMWTRRIARAPKPWMRHLEPALATATGLVLTLFAAWTIHERETHNRDAAFTQLAASRTDVIAKALRVLRDTELEGLARFHEGSAQVGSEEFRRYTDHLTKDPVILAWEWVPAVPEAGRSRFEAASRAAGQKGFGIWQNDAEGRRVPAFGRAVYYPVSRTAPLEGNERALGFDLGSEPSRRAALEEAMRTGLATATRPLALVQAAGRQKGMLIFHPVFDVADRRRLRGFTVAAVRMGTLLRSAGPDASVLMGLSRLRAEAAPEPLAVSWDAEDPPKAGLSAMRPVFAFGEVFAATARAGPEFMRLRPMRAGWAALVAGTLVTASLAAMMRVHLRRRKIMESLVARRTRELQASEAHLSATLRSIGDGVITCDVAGNVVNLNAVAEALTGWTTEEARKRPIAEIFRVTHAETRQAVPLPIAQALRENRITGLAVPTALTARDGAERQISDSCAPIHGASGTTLGAVLVFRDVSEEYRQREQLRESDARYRQLFEKSPDPYLILDGGVIAECNDAALALLRASRAQVVGRAPDTFSPERQPDGSLSASLAAIHNREATEAGSARFEWLHHRMDGTEVWVDVSLAQMPLAGRPTLLVSWRNITAQKQLEETIRSSEENFRTFFQTVDDMIVVGAPDGRILFTNDAFNRKLGYSQAALGTMRLHDLHPEECRDEAREAFEAMSLGRRDSCPLPLQAGNGARFPTETRRWLGKWDGRECIFSVSKDLSIQQAALDKFQKMFNNNPALMTVSSLPERRVVDVNDAFLARLGFAREDVVGRTVAELGLFPDLPAQTRMEEELRRAGRIAGAELRIRARTGELLDGLFSGEVIESQGQKVFLTVMTDLTAQKRGEEALRQATLELARARDEAFAAVRARSQFLANMSHEIRTPMNGVLGMAELLAGTELTPEQRDCVEMINRSSDGLLSLLNDILDFSKMEAGQLTLERVPFNLEYLVYDTVELFRSEIEGRPIELLVDFDPATPLHVVGDPGRLRQVLNNLVGNAVKFTERGHILIEAGSALLGGTRIQLILAVKDTGIGIAPETQGLLFQPFMQADASTARRFGGTGLGLTIVKRLAEAMGGQVRMQSREGSGTTFTVELELGLDPRHSEDLLGAIDFNGVRILMVDDLPVNLRLLRRQLSSRGVVTEAASSGAEALRLIQEAQARGEPFAAAVVDLYMPGGMDGEALGRAVRAEARCRFMALVALTAMGVRGDAGRLANVGFDAYLVKPIRGDLLFRAIAMAMNRARQEVKAALITRHTVSDSGSRASAAEQMRLDARILLVEDQETNQIVARKFLERAGARISVAANGVEALRFLEGENADIVLMDCQMPEMDGFETTARIRAREEGTGRHLPIIAMTAHALAGDRDRCLQAGMDDYLTKPIRREALLQGVARWLPKRPERTAEAAPPEDAGLPSGADSGLELDEAIFANLLVAFGRDAGQLSAAVLQPFLGTGLERLDVMRRCVAEGDAGGLETAAHALKGSSLTLGLNALAQAAGRLELEAGKAAQQDLAGWVDETRQAFSLARAFLEEVIGNGRARTEGP